MDALRQRGATGARCVIFEPQTDMSWNGADGGAWGKKEEGGARRRRNWPHLPRGKWLPRSRNPWWFKLHAKTAGMTFLHFSLRLLVHYIPDPWQYAFHVSPASLSFPTLHPLLLPIAPNFYLRRSLRSMRAFFFGGVTLCGN